MADFHSPEILAKYPSLQKYIDLGDDYVEWKDGRESRLLVHIKSLPNFSSEIVGNPSALLAAMDDFAAKEDFLISIGPHKATVLKELLRSDKPERLVELGGYVGYSAIFFAHELKQQIQGPGAELEKKPHVWSLEFEESFAEIIREFVDIAGLSEHVTVVTGDAAESLGKLGLEKIDWLFLDHVEDLYERDFKVAEGLGLLKKGSVVVADNVVRPGAPEYRQFVRGHAGLESRGIRGLIVPGEIEDELEYSRVL